MARTVGAFNRESFSPLILDAARELATPERAPPPGARLPPT
jgi:hypothetical protein